MKPLVPLCLVHSVPHPCVSCRQHVPEAVVAALDRLADDIERGERIPVAAGREP